jgi:starch-binding outer membrane protein, SusD/RagB family
MKRNIILLLASIVIVVSVIIACNKKLNVLDENDPTTKSYFNSAVELQNGVNGVYSTMRSGNLWGREGFYFHEVRGGEMAAGGPQLGSSYQEVLLQPSPSTANGLIGEMWIGSYQMINRANLVISKAAGVTDDPALRDVTVGEAEFLRAWAYFELVVNWGDVPLYTEPVTSATGYKGKSPAADIYTLILSDLTDAASKLPVSSKDAGRATSGAAYAMLGRVNIQKGDYAAAKTALLNVYGKYALAPNFSDNFNGDVKLGSTQLNGFQQEFNQESIFELAFVDKGDDNFNWGYVGEGATADASIMRSQEYGIVWGNVIPSDQILDEFEAGDPRYKFTFYESGDNIVTVGGTATGVALTESGMNVLQSKHNGVAQKRVYRKYSVLDYTSDGFHPDGVNQRLIRYADVLLMLAECEAEVGSLTTAAGYINEVRNRTGVKMPAVTLTSHDEAIKAVMHEYAVEFAGEERANNNIFRWRAKGYYPSIRPDPVPGQVTLLPIPAAETSANPLIH